VKQKRLLTSRQHRSRCRYEANKEEDCFLIFWDRYDAHSLLSGFLRVKNIWVKVTLARVKNTAVFKQNLHPLAASRRSLRLGPL